MPLEQIVILAIVQGITEFLPISSSGHLILTPIAFGWKQQGLMTDVMVHVGSLFAILVYFWRDVIRLFFGGLDLITLRWSENARFAFYIAIGTIPAVAFALFLETSGFQDYIRQDENTILAAQIVAFNLILFGLLLFFADHYGLRINKIPDMRIGGAIFIGLAQALALIPGTSRSGVTITAARAFGFDRSEAARFSFLLGVPAIAGAGVFKVADVVKEGQSVPPDAIMAGILSFFSALAAIAFLMALVKRMSFLPFVVYRLALGAFILGLVYMGPELFEAKP